MYKKRFISIVSPCHNEEGNIKQFVKELKYYIKGYRHEIVLVDDGSRDKTKEAIMAEARKDKNVKGVFLYKNYGHQAALSAGYKYCKGDAVISLDSDFQHPPKHIPEFIKKWEQGHDLVVAQKKTDSSMNLLVRTARDFGYSIWSSISGGILVKGVSDFRLADKHLVKYINSLQETRVFTRGIMMQQAKNPAVIGYDVGKRVAGESKYGFKLKNINRTIKLISDGVVSFSFAPLRMASVLGILIVMGGLGFLMFALFEKLVLRKNIIEGWTTLVTLQIISTGFLTFYLGILGEYLSVIFEEVKKRPKYVVKDTVNI